ncbi:hypothetical protein ACFCYN_25050 [Gottfriedia sp. NPDC056225]|uniref:hypothetical protein n=1 Tax=Gottfriedia sp. NPDC056225 TaxID=3345751 RepID=UPI0035E2EA21
MRYKMLIVSLFVLVSGCSKITSGEEKLKQDTHLNSTEKVEHKSSDTNKPQKNGDDFELLDIGPKFSIPDFNITNFDIKVRKGEIHLEFTYNISPKLYEFLKRKPIYYFGIEFPQDTNDIVKLDRTSLVQGPMLLGKAQTYTISFNENIPVSLTQTEIDQLEKNQLGYRLHILNKEKANVHTYDDIELASQVDPKKSKPEFFTIKK